jgi:hypothetical protein
MHVAVALRDPRVARDARCVACARELHGTNSRAASLHRRPDRHRPSAPTHSGRPFACSSPRPSQSHPTLRFEAPPALAVASLPTAMAASFAARRLLSRATAARRLALPVASAPAIAHRRFSADAGPPPPTQTLPPPPLEPVAEPPRTEGASSSSSSTTAGAGGAHSSSPGAAAGARRQGGAGYEEEQEKVLRASLLHVVAISNPPPPNQLPFSRVLVI